MLNVGSKMESTVGMTFKLSRGDRELGEAIVSSIRKNVSGLLVVAKSHKDVVFRVGDKAQVKLQPR